MASPGRFCFPMSKKGSNCKTARAGLDRKAKHFVCEICKFCQINATPGKRTKGGSLNLSPLQIEGCLKLLFYSQTVDALPDISPIYLLLIAGFDHLKYGISKIIIKQYKSRKACMKRRFSEFFLFTPNYKLSGVWFLNLTLRCGFLKSSIVVFLRN